MSLFQAPASCKVMTNWVTAFGRHACPTNLMTCLFGSDRTPQGSGGKTEAGLSLFRREKTDVCHHARSLGSSLILAEEESFFQKTCIAEAARREFVCLKGE